MIENIKNSITEIIPCPSNYNLYSIFFNCRQEFNDNLQKIIRLSPLIIH